MTRDEFRNSVFERDNYKCIICGQHAIDAHHIIERRLWDDGGYHLSNGASLCEEHHLSAERTDITCEDLWDSIGVTKPFLPQDFDEEYKYDKWGNVLIMSHTRLPGPLFHDVSVQRIMKDHLEEFLPRIKYPRTFHLPFSPIASDDDKILHNLDHFYEENGRPKEIVITAKMDGENSNLYRDGYHARSINENYHLSRDWIKNFQAQIGYEIPEGWRLCGENLYAKHSIGYSNLLSYFLLFSIWNEKNECLSWDDTLEWAHLLGLEVVPVLYRGNDWTINMLKGICPKELNGNKVEGYVMRITDGFSYLKFKHCVAKYVQNPITSENHWRFKELTPNKLKP